MPHSALPDQQYRADIDGLRAIAVLSVIFFHAFPNGLLGGFVGVDIFFVISGFLISRIILSGLHRDEFNFVRFYSNRIRRIFPALIVVLAACITFGWFALLPSEYEQLGKHIAAGGGFVSNFVFWQEAGYFDTSAPTKPLLHLWSLAIEEQYYIVWPLLLYLAWRWRFSIGVLVCALAAISFSANTHFLYADPSQAFFSPLTRVWELLTGSLLAYLAHKKISVTNQLLSRFKPAIGNSSTVPNWFSSLQSIFGALFIGIAVLLANKYMTFPGGWTLLPTLGAYLIISAGQNAWFNRTVLSHRLMVGIGLISYPLYLWHWPILSFAWIMEAKTPSLEIRLVAIAIAFTLAWLTYRLIEHPIRFGQYARAKIISLPIVMALLAGLGYLTFSLGGYRDRPSMQTMVAQADELNYERHWDGWSQCPIVGKGETCRILNPNRTPSIMLIGDSHAGHLASGLEHIYKMRSENIEARINPGCLPFFETKYFGSTYFSCNRGLMNRYLDEAINSTSVRTIILTGYAIRMIHGNRGESPDGFESDDYFESQSKESIRINSNIFQNAMNLTLERILASGKHVIFIADVPELYFDPTECAALRPIALSDKKTPCGVSREKFETRSAEYHRIIAEAKVAFPTVKFVDAWQSFCDQALCYGSLEGELLYSTRDHLTPAGSRHLIRSIENQLM